MKKVFLAGIAGMAGEWVGYTTLSPLTSRLVAPSCWWFSWARAAARGFERKKRREEPFKNNPSSLTRPALTAGSQAPLSRPKSERGGRPRRSKEVRWSCFGSRESTTYKHPPSSGPASHFLLPLKERERNGGAYCRMKLLGTSFPSREKINTSRWE